MDVGPMGCQTNGLSDQWAIGPMSVGPMGCRTNGLSEQRPVSVTLTGGLLLRNVGYILSLVSNWDSELDTTCLTKHLIAQIFRYIVDNICHTLFIL